MTTFLLDARGLSPSSDDGSGRVVRALVRHLPHALAPDERLVVLAPATTCDLLSAETTAPRLAFLPCEIRTASLEQHASMPRVVAAIAPEVWLYPQYDLPPVPRGTAAVAIVHDLTPVFEAGYFGPRRGLRQIAAGALVASTCARAAVVVTDATAIRSELCRLFPRYAGRMDVIPPGPSYLPSPRPTPRERDRFVYVGNHRPHKRVPLLLQAFAIARRRRPSLRLVLAGRSDPRFPEVPRLLQGALGDGVTLLEGPTDLEVATALASSRALVFPSVGEGFGFPVVEALSVGTPCIVADAGSLPEVTGPAGLVIARDDVRALADALVRLAEDDTLWQRLATEAAPTLARYSWERYADAMLATMRAAARSLDEEGRGRR